LDRRRGVSHRNDPRKRIGIARSGDPPNAAAQEGSVESLIPSVLREAAEGPHVTRPLFAVAKIDECACDLCGAPASFQIPVALVDAENKFCGACSIAYVLQFFKNSGVDIAVIQEAFPKLSAALEARVSNFVM
jgi:hypothetical protein